jgi:hypothetical protein
MTLSGKQERIHHNSPKGKTLRAVDKTVAALSAGRLGMAGFARGVAALLIFVAGLQATVPDSIGSWILIPAPVAAPSTQR